MNDVELARWGELVSTGTRSAMQNLGMMLGQEIEVGSFGLRRVGVEEIAELMGGPETTSVGIYLTVSGSADGHMMLMYEPTTACSFVDMLMMLPPGTTDVLGDMERSALGEMGNITGAGFLNAISDKAGIDLRPSPPMVLTDMAGALLDIVAADISLTQDEAFIAETEFTAPDRRITGMFFVIPSQALLSVMAGLEKVA